MQVNRLAIGMASLVLILLLSACATRTSERAAELAIIANQDLVCDGEAACRQMWTKASNWVKENAGFRFVRTEFNRITVWCSFARSDGYHTAYVIERFPIEGEKSRLTLTFGTQSGVTLCVPTDLVATEADFKKAVLG